jgi:DNA-binding MarR family transcriptional regulator
MAKSRAAQLKRDLAEALRRHSTKTVLFHAAVADRLGLGPADHKCLDLLIRFGPQTAGELAVQTALTTGAITGVIDRLERAGYAERTADPADRRRVVVRPVAEKIKAELEPLFANVARATAAMLDGYTDAQLEFLLDFLRRADQLADEQTALLRRP